MTAGRRVFDGCESLLQQLHMWSCHVGNMMLVTMTAVGR